MSFGDTYDNNRKEIDEKERRKAMAEIIRIVRLHESDEPKGLTWLRDAFDDVLSANPRNHVTFARELSKRQEKRDY